MQDTGGIDARKETALSTLRRDTVAALGYSWLILAAVLFAAALIPFLLPAAWIVRAAPVCEAKRRGSECGLCGMTTAYIAIGRRDFETAEAASAGALPLWSASLLNFPASLAYLILAVRRRH